MLGRRPAAGAPCRRGYVRCVDGPGVDVVLRVPEQAAVVRRLVLVGVVDVDVDDVRGELVISRHQRASPLRRNWIAKPAMASY